MHTKLSIQYSPATYVPELDGIRGIAIILVVLYHCFHGPLIGLGWVGVDLFFVLSGFLITGILIDSKGSKRYYFNFIGRRILRIFPLYYLVLFGMFLIVPALVGLKSGTNFGFYIDHQIWFWSYLQNWLYSSYGFPENLVLVHFWSLAVEEQFYLIWPWLVLWVPDRYLVKVSLILCAFSIVFRLLPLEWFHFAAPYRYLNTFSRMDALLIGSIIAQIVRTNKRILEKWAVPVGISGLVIFIIGVVVEHSFRFMLLPYYYTAIDLFMGMILILSLSNFMWIRKILRFKGLTFFGKYSYGLYVYHYIIYILLEYKLGPWLSVHLPGVSSVLLMLILGLTVVTISLILSVLSFYFYEAHFLKLKRYFHSSPQKQNNDVKIEPSLKLSR